MWFSLGISSLTLKTKDVIFEDGDSIILNCTYYKNNTEYISNRDIRWQKRIGNVFKDIAVFSPPGGQEPFITLEVLPFYINRTELIAPKIPLSAVLVIKYPVCSDQGVHRCKIEYFSDSLNKVQTRGSVVKLKCNYFFFINTKQFNNSFSYRLISLKI